MNYLNKICLLFFLTIGVFSCDNIEAPISPEDSSNEVFIEGDGGTKGMEVLSNDGFVIFNTNRFSILDQDGGLVKQIPATNHIFANLTVDGSHLFLTGRSSSENIIGLSAFDINGDLLWDKFITFTDGDVEIPFVRVIDDQLILAFISKNKEGESQNHRTINIEVFSKNGSTVETSKIIFEAEHDFFTYNLLVESKENFLVQGSRVISDSQSDEGDIQVYRFINGELVWYKSVGPQGFSVVNKVIKSPLGSYLFVGSKQIAAWAFELDADGNILWDLDHGDGTNKFWFFDALYKDNSIHFCGFTNATPEQLDAGLLFTTGLRGSGGVEKIYGGDNLYRHFAIASREPDELVFAGDRSFPQGNRFDSWIMFTDGSGERE
ncbi:hypothetical protein [Aquiflexum sp.]|uniref:hypothetical protein n=1 Tax=Aquiflexum sp. TaxID=1872584 RepID=UPI003593F11D